MELQLGLQEEAIAFVCKSPFIHQCNKQTLSDCTMLKDLLGLCLRWKVSILDLTPALGPQVPSPFPYLELPLIIGCFPLHGESCYHPVLMPIIWGNENKMRGSQSSTGLNIGLKPAMTYGALILFFLAFGCNLLPSIFQVHAPRVRAEMLALTLSLIVQ